MNDENKRAGANEESSPFNLRLPHKTREKLDAVAAMLPILSAHRIALAALDIGLDALTADPSKVLSVEVAPRGSAIRGARGTSSSGAMRGARGTSSSGAMRGARGTSSSGSATDDQAPEEPPLVRAPSMPPARASVRPPPALDPSRFSSPLPALPSMPPPRVPADLVVPEAVELDDDDDDQAPVNGAGQLALIAEPPAAPAPDAAAVRARLKALQAAEPRAWSLRKIADLAGVSTAPVAKVLNGKNVTQKYLAAIAKILPPEHMEKTSS